MAVENYKIQMKDAKGNLLYPKTLVALVEGLDAKVKELVGMGDDSKTLDDLTEAIGVQASDGVSATGLYKLIADGDASTLTSATKALNDLVGTLKEGEFTYSTVVEYVKAIHATANDANKVTIATDTTTDGYLKSYTIKQGGISIGVIDIPKDLVVTSGEVVKDPEGQTAGTYVKLTIANQTAPIYINVADLCDAYTAQQSATQVQLAVSDTNEISATIVAGSITKTELHTDVVKEIEQATTVIATLNGDESKDGSVKKALKDAKDYADGKIDGLGGDQSGTSNGVTVEVKTSKGEVSEVKVTAPDFANTYEAKGAAATVKNELTGTEDDSKDTLTLNGLKKAVDAVSGAHSVVNNTADTDTLKGQPTVSYTTDASTGAATYTVSGGILYTIVEETTD